MIHFKLNNNKQENLIQFNLKNSLIKINPFKNDKFNPMNKLKISFKIYILRILNKVWNL